MGIANSQVSNLQACKYKKDKSHIEADVKNKISMNLQNELKHICVLRNMSLDKNIASSMIGHYPNKKINLKRNNSRNT